MSSADAGSANGRCVLVTRPGAAGESLALRLWAEGTRVSWQAAISKTPKSQGLADCVTAFESSALMLVTSPEVLALFQEAEFKIADLPMNLLVVGRGSAAEWREAGKSVVLSAATLRGLLSLIRNEKEGEASEILASRPRVLWPRGNLYQEDLARELRELCDLREIEVYETQDAYLATELNLDELGEDLVVHFASPSAVRSFESALGRIGAEARRAGWAAVAIGPTTAAALDPEVWRKICIAGSSDEDAQVAAIHGVSR